MIASAADPKPAVAGPTIETPCVKVCTLDASAGLCLGCGRNLDEIARWSRMSPAERRGVIDQLEPRLAALRGPSGATANLPG